MKKKKLIISDKAFKSGIQNSLSDAIFGGANQYNQGFGVQLSQAETLFRNNRWYLISNMRQLLCEIYVEHGLVQTVIDVPVDDGLRGGVEIKSKQLDATEVEELTTEMERQNDLGIVGQALKWNRLFGGAGILIMTDQDPMKPLRIEAIGEDSPLEFRAVDMWELFWNKQNTGDYAALIDTQELVDVDFYNYYGSQVDKSRVMKMIGLIAPSFIRPKLRGWGFSIMEAIVRSINQYLKANDLTFEVLDEFKVDAYKIKNLTNTLLSPGGTELVRRRIQLANQQKNYQNAIVMDGEDDFIQKQLSFTGMGDVMTQIRMQIASDLRMPLSKVFGISSTGFSSGEDDIENYNAMVESQVRQKCKFDILRVIELRCQKLFGYVPDDISISFKPLRILSAEQEENVKTQQFNRVLQARQAGELTRLEFRDSCNKDQLIGVQLETDDKVMKELEDEQQEMQEAATAVSDSTKKSVTQAKEAKT